jgi:(p)ppGpp synthase/HD superfamily hydrolase
MYSQKFIDFAKEYYKDASHPLAVASNFKELTDEWVVALFHDILEDTQIKENDLFMFLTRYDRNKVYLEITKITRKKEESYFDYINRLKKENDVAMRVKIADLRHNLSRTETLKPSLKQRYEKALKILLS